MFFILWGKLKSNFMTDMLLACWQGAEHCIKSTGQTTCVENSGNSKIKWLVKSWQRFKPAVRDNDRFSKFG